MAIECNCYENIGYDLVAICVNDVLESGTEPVAFLDYIACGKLQVPVAAQIIKGISEACRESNCALLGNYSFINLFKLFFAPISKRCVTSNISFHRSRPYPDVVPFQPIN